MNRVVKIGYTLPVDARGFIVRRASPNQIVSPWRSLIDEITRAYRIHWGDRVHSIYIRGSVAAGQAILGISDVDSFAVVSGDYTQCDRSWFDAFNREIVIRYPFCKGVELSAISRDRLLDCSDEGYWGLRMLIATQSACIWGEDISEDLPRFKPDIDAVSHAFDLRDDLRQVTSDLSEIVPQMPPGERSAYTQKICRWIMKRIVRSGFEIVMEKKQCYTRDLYPCYQLFAESYPSRKSEMYRALTWAIEPTDDSQAIVDFLNDFGTWLADEIDRVYPPH